MKGVIVYKGKYGATKQYAEWLSTELKLPIKTPAELNAVALAQYDFVVAGGSIYVGKIGLKKWLQQHADLLNGKKVFLFIVCATPPDQTDKLELLRRENVPATLLNTCQVYFLHGRLVKKNLSLLDKFVLHMGAMLQKDPADRKKMLTDFDDVRKENLIPLVKDGQYYTTPGKTVTGAMRFQNS